MAFYSKDIDLYAKDAMTNLIKAQETKFDVVQGKISAMISESELAELENGHSTMYSRLANVELTASGLTADFSQMQTRYDDMSGDIETLQSDSASYSASISGLSSSVSSLQSGLGTTNSNVSSLSQTVNGINTRVNSLNKTLQDDYYTSSQVDSAISQSATSITQTVSSTYVKKADGITSVEVQYAVGTSSTTAPTSGWSTSTPSWTTGKYIWQRTMVTKNGQPTPTNVACIQGAKGTDVTISSTSVMYQASTSATTAPTGTWSTKVPTVAEGSYLWTRTIVEYSDGSSTQSYSVAKQGKSGTNGTNGTNGKDGKGVKSVSPQWYLSTSNQDRTGGTWLDYKPDYVRGRYYWTRSKIVYDTTPETSSNSAPVLDLELNGLETRMYSAEQKITDTAIVQTVTSSTAWGTKVTKGEVILAINNESSAYTINADKINFNGLVTANNNFKINTDGSMETIAGKIGGWDISSTELTSAVDTDESMRFKVFLNSANTRLGVKMWTSTLNNWVDIVYFTKRDFYMQYQENPERTLEMNGNDFRMYHNTYNTSTRKITKRNHYVELQYDWLKFYSNFNRDSASNPYSSPIERISLTRDGLISSEYQGRMNLYVRGGTATGTNLTGFSLENKTNSIFYYGHLSEASDSRLKKNIKTIKTNVTDLIDKLNVVSFDWREGGRHVDAGLIAQDTQGLFPSLIVNGPDDYLNINYVGFIPYLIKAVQELSQMVKDLQS